MKKLKLTTAITAITPVIAGTMLTMAASQTYAAAVTVTTQSITVTASATVDTVINSQIAGTGDFTVSGTNLGDAAVVDAAWGGGGIDSTITVLSVLTYSVDSSNQRVNYSNATTAAPAAITNDSVTFSNVSCINDVAPNALDALVCGSATGVDSELGPWETTDSEGVFNAFDITTTPPGSGTTTVTFTSFTDTENFAGTITTFTTDGAASATTRETVYAFESVAAVPVPAAAWLFGSALLGLAGVSRKRKA